MSGYLLTISSLKLEIELEKISLKMTRKLSGVGVARHFGVLHTSLYLMFIYCRHGIWSVIAAPNKTVLSHRELKKDNCCVQYSDKKIKCLALQIPFYYLLTYSMQLVPS